MRDPDPTGGRAVPSGAPELAAAAALKEPLARAATLGQAVALLRPEMGDEDEANPRSMLLHPKLGGTMLADWASRHLRWEDLQSPEDVDIGSAARDATNFRGRRVCMRGKGRFVSIALRFGEIESAQGKALYRHNATIVGTTVADDLIHEVGFCGVIIGRIVPDPAVPANQVLPGLVLVGMLAPP